MQIISLHRTERHAKLELKPAINKCLLLAMDCGHYLNKHPRTALWKRAKWKEWFWKILPWERHKMFSVEQHRKVTHFPEGSQLFPSCLNICKATAAKESPPCSTVLPYFYPSSPLPTTCKETLLLELTRQQQALATSRCGSTELCEETKRKSFNYKGQNVSAEVPCSISQFNVICNS